MIHSRLIAFFQLILQDELLLRGQPAHLVQLPRRDDGQRRPPPTQPQGDALVQGRGVQGAQQEGRPTEDQGQAAGRQVSENHRRQSYSEYSQVV